MNWLLDLTLRGSLMFAVVAVLDRLLAARISARARRAWWLLVPVAFLLTIRVPVLPSAAPPAPWMERHWLPAWPANNAEPAPAAPPGTVALLHPANVNWLALILATGSTGYLLVAVVRTHFAVRRWRRERLSTNAELLELLEDCKREAGITAPIGLVISGVVTTPVILGWLRPRILLPAELAAALSPDQLRGVLFHELSHFRALDIPLNWFFTLVCALHWFNPAAHLAFRRWTQFCEESADEAAITWLGQPSILAYGETLLRVLRQAGGQPAPFTALAVVESVSQLKKRLHMIKQYPSKMTRPLLAGTIFFAVAAGILLRPVRAADAPWGEVIDPDGDCRLVFTDDKLAVSIPGKDHALSAEVGRMNAPRVLQDVTGDFVAQVKVSGDYPTSVTSAVPDFVAWQGAGLLLWQDAKNYIRLERAQLVAEGQATSYVVFELRKDGAVVDYSGTNEHRLTGRATFLKLERHGDKVSAAVSPDGGKWTLLKPLDWRGPQNLRVGVSASQDTSTPLNVELEDFNLTPATGTPVAKPGTPDNTAKPPVTSTEVRVGSTTVAVLPMLPANTIDVSATKEATYNQETRLATFKGDAKLVFTVPGKPAVTISSDELSLKIRK